MRLGQGLGGALHLRQLERDPHRRVPAGPARARARDQQRRGDRRLVHRPPARRRARAVRLAARLPRLGADRAASRRSGRTAACTSCAPPPAARIDWWGNATFAAGLVAVMVGITYGIQPYGGHAMGWTITRRARVAWPSASRCWPRSAVIESASTTRCSTSASSACARSPPGTSPSFLSSIGRGGLQFVLIVWLQGIWLPAARLRLRPDAALGRHLHAARDRRDPVAGPASGYLSDRYGARPFATGGMLVAGADVPAADPAAGATSATGGSR